MTQSVELDFMSSTDTVGREEMLFNVKSLKRSQPASSDQESSNSTEKKTKIIKANDLKTVMERVNVFLVSIDSNDDV